VVQAPIDSWLEEWGDKARFEEYARNKCAISLRTGMPTSVVIKSHPWILREGDCLYEGGYAESPDLAIGVSGAEGETDERIAKLVFDRLRTLCAASVANLRESGKDFLE
jgi:hypothetical protein